jgi:uncharacterized protein
MRTSLGTYYREWIIDRPIRTLILFLMLTLAMIYFLSDFRKDLSAYRDLKEVFPSSDDFLVIAYQPDISPFTQEGLARFRQLVEKLQVINRVTAVNSILNVPLLNQPDLTLSNLSEKTENLTSSGVDLEKAQQSMLKNPLYYQLLLSEDAKTFAIQIVFSGVENLGALIRQRDMLRQKKINQELDQREEGELRFIEERIKDANIQAVEIQNRLVADVRAVMALFTNHGKIHLGGVPMIMVDMIDYIRGDIKVFGFSVLGFIIGSLAIIFRRVRWVLLPVGCCLLTCVLSAGFVGWLQFPVTVISSNFISLLLISTMSLIVHLVVRYRECAAMYPQSRQSSLVSMTMESMAEPSFYNAFTNIVGFLSLMVSQIRPIIDFGIMMTVGILFSYLVVYFAFPAVLMLMPRSKGRLEEEKEDKLSIVLAKITHAFGAPLVWMAALSSIIFFYGFSQLSVDNRFIDYFKKETEIYKGMEVIDVNLGGTTPMDIVLDFSLEKKPTQDTEDCFSNDSCAEDEQQSIFTKNNIDRIKEIHHYLEALPEVGKVLSIATTVELAELVKKSDLDPVELAFMSTVFPKELKDLLLNPYVNEQSGQFRISLRFVESVAGLNRQKVMDKIKHYLAEDAKLDMTKVQLVGIGVLYNNLLQSLYQSQISTIGFTFLSIFIMFLVMFRSIKLAVIALLPNIWATLVVLGTMGLVGISLDLMTITIAAISIGFTVDNAIYYIHRFKEEYAMTNDYKKAMFKSHASIGRGVYYTSLTVIAGFSILSFSNFYPTIYFGLFTSLVMLVALIASLSILPQLILWLKPFKESQHLSQADLSHFD